MRARIGKSTVRSDRLRAMRPNHVWALDVLDGHVEAVRPREDRAAEVATLLDQAFESFVGVAPAVCDFRT